MAGEPRCAVGGKALGTSHYKLSSARRKTDTACLASAPTRPSPVQSGPQRLGLIYASTPSPQVVWCLEHPQLGPPPVTGASCIPPRPAHLGLLTPAPPPAGPFHVDLSSILHQMWCREIRRSRGTNGQEVGREAGDQYSRQQTRPDASRTGTGACRKKGLGKGPLGAGGQRRLTEVKDTQSLLGKGSPSCGELLAQGETMHPALPSGAHHRPVGDCSL